MGALHRLAFWMLFTYGLCGCSSQRDARREERIAISAEHEEAGEATASERTTRVAGPVDVVTVTEEFGPSSPNGPDTPQGGFTDSAGSQGSLRGPLTAARPPDVAPTLPAHGPLVKRITRTEHRGPVEAVKDRELRTETASRDTLAVDAGTESTETEKSAPSPSCAFGGYLWALAAIGVAVALWRVRR